MKIFNQNLTPIERFLCLAIQTQQPENFVQQYQELDDQELWQVAKLNRVASIVAHALLTHLPKVPKHWIQTHEQLKDRINSYLKELDLVADLFEKQGIPLIVLKNGGIARGIHDCPACVPMGDLDLLINQKDFYQAHQILLDNNYTLKFRKTDLQPTIEVVKQEGGGEYQKNLTSNENLWLELQWRAVSGRWINPEQEPKTENLFADSIAIPETKARLLSPEDNLVQVCLHTAKHSYLRAPGFRLHLDVERIVKKQQLNWALFLKKVLDLKTKTPVYFSLLIPKLLLNTAIPDEILNKLKPGRIKRALIWKAIEKAGLFNPDEKKFSRLGYIFFTALLYDSWLQLLKTIKRLKT